MAAPMPRELPVSVIEIKPEPRGSKTRDQLTAAEKSRILPAIASCSRIVALDERGKDLPPAEPGYSIFVLTAR